MYAVNKSKSQFYKNYYTSCNIHALSSINIEKYCA